MKKNLMLIPFFLALLFLTACGGEGESYKVFFKTADGDRLLSEDRVMANASEASEKEKVEFLVTELTKSPKTDGGINVLPDAVKVNSVKISGSTAIIDISGEYYNNDDVDELLARIAIVDTLCEIEGIDGVRIKVDGVPLVSTTTGAEIGIISRNDVVNGPQDKAIVEKETVTIYFPDKNGEMLVAEKREIEVQASLSVERLIISELAKGPQNKDLVQVLPSELKVISTETKDGVCFVNLSADFIDKISAGSSSTTMALYSIVNSLTELEEIDSVQILVDGKTGAEFGNYVLDTPLERNKKLIKD